MDSKPLNFSKRPLNLNSSHLQPTKSKLNNDSSTGMVDKLENQKPRFSSSVMPMNIEIFESEKKKSNTEYIKYLKTMISNLLQNQMTLSAAIDETREACSQLTWEKLDLQKVNSQEVHNLQTELSHCRQRNAEMTLAYEELQYRVKSIDEIIEQVPWLDTLFNSLEPLQHRINILQTKSFDKVTTTNQSNSKLKPNSVDLQWQVKKKQIIRSDSPLSDSGCTSESHDEFSLNSLTSAQSSPYLRSSMPCSELEYQSQQVNSLANSCNKPSNLTRSKSSVENCEKQTVQLRKQATFTDDHLPISTFGKLTASFRNSITKFADKSEWKLEALNAKHREARTILLLNETQEEVRKIESRCSGLKRQQDQQEARLSLKIKEVEALNNTERQLRYELRNWQNRVFEMEIETQELQRNFQISELESKFRLCEYTSRISQLEQLLQQNSIFSNFIKTPPGLLNSTNSLAITPETNENVSVQINKSKPPHQNDSLNYEFKQRFASVSNLNLVNQMSSGQSSDYSQTNQNLNKSRPSSTCQLNAKQNFDNGGLTKIENANNPIGQSFGSLSELQLKNDC